MAESLEIPTDAAANDIFAVFDGPKNGILHVRDMASGLAVLCDGCTAPSVLCACRLYIGANGDMGFSEIAGFTTSIFKVCCVCRGTSPLRLYMLDYDVGSLLAVLEESTIVQGLWPFDPQQTLYGVVFAQGRGVALEC